MRNFTAFLLLLGISFLVPQKILATHIIGGEISFEVIAPGVYVGTYIGYSEVINAGSLPATVTFNLRSPGCNTGTTFQGNRQSMGSQHINGVGCSGGAQVGFAVYTTTFALPLPHPQCSDWYLSVRECNNGMGINIAPAQNSCIYVEALLTPYTGTFQKSAPRFLPPTSLFFNINTPASFSNQAININPDTQHDSIVYSLKPAQNDHSIPLRYTANTTFLQPIPSGSGVSLHPRSGALTFTPNVFSGNVSTGHDAYTVVIEAAIYRWILGAPVKVSTSQRNLPVYIFSDPANQNPEIVNATANGQAIQANQVFQAQSGATINFQFSTSDADPADNLMLALPDPQFAGFPANVTSSATVTPGSKPNGSLVLNTTAWAHDQLFYFPVMVMDNACRGVTTRMFGVKLLAKPLGTHYQFQKEAGFTAFPNPFSSQISFRFQSQSKAERIRIYDLLGNQIEEIQVPASLTEGQHIQWKNASKHAAGMYVAKLISGNKILQTLKFTKLQ